MVCVELVGSCAGSQCEECSFGCMKRGRERESGRSGSRPIDSCCFRSAFVGGGGTVLFLALGAVVAM